jgi:hypothetical protein
MPSPKQIEIAPAVSSARPSLVSSSSNSNEPKPESKTQVSKSTVAAASMLPNSRPQTTETSKDVKASSEKSASATSSSPSSSLSKDKDRVCLDSHTVSKPACPARDERPATDGNHTAPAAVQPAAATPAPAQVAAKVDSGSAALASQPPPVSPAREERVVAGFGVTPTLLACMLGAMVLGGAGTLLVWVLIRHRPLPAETYQLINDTLRTVDAYLAASGTGHALGAGHGMMPYVLSSRVSRESAPEPAGVPSSRSELIRNIIDENLQLRS